MVFNNATMLDCDQSAYYDNNCEQSQSQYEHQHQHQQQQFDIQINQRQIDQRGQQQFESHSRSHSKSFASNNNNKNEGVIVVDSMPLYDSTYRLNQQATNILNNNNISYQDGAAADVTRPQINHYLSDNNNNNNNETISDAMVIDRPTVIAMVGLPARGKTFISKKVREYLYNQIGLEGRVFNVGEYRRLSTDYTAHDFFRSDNKQALAIRNKLALDALEDMCSWLAKGDDRVAIYDATNSTKDRREIIYDTVVCKYNYNLFFVESICDDKSIIEANIMMKSHSPDYEHVEDKLAAINDFKQRIEHYKSRYQSLDANDPNEYKYSFVQIYNAGQRLCNHHCKSQIQKVLFHYLVKLC